MNQKEFKKGVHIGKRDGDFKMLITSILKKGKINKSYIELLTNEKNMQTYSSVFTSEHVDPVNNYQVFEMLGDVSANKFIVFYIYKRFPQLKCVEGVKVVARIKINYGSKQTFSDIGEKLGLWPFISASIEDRENIKTSLLEDVFEAFIGATESMLDEQVKHGIGYAVVYKILETIFNSIDISVEYKDLYDSITRLKELADMHKEKINKISYMDEKVEVDAGDSQASLTKVTVFQNNNIVIGHAVCDTKTEAKQVASEMAIKTLENRGIYKLPPSIYAKFSAMIKGEEVKDVKTDKNNILKICEDEKNINNQFFTQGRSKSEIFQKYTSTPLAFYVKKRDMKGIEICLELGADPNIVNSVGLTCLDLLLLGASDEEGKKFVKKVFKKFRESSEELKVHKGVFDVYWGMYELKKKKIEIVEEW